MDIALLTRVRTSNNKQEFKALAAFILEYQVVQHGDTLFWVFRGSGMGFTMSGDIIPDLCFSYLVEHGFVDSLEIRSRYGIQFYARFKDDFVIISN